MASTRTAAYPTATEFLPSRVTLPSLRSAAAGCQGCPLYLTATQTVFGEGPARARVMFVGEQPGDIEDQKGKPFVGPAGRLFDQALTAAGLDRKTVYLTNAVKHFKFEQRGKRRLHQRPKPGEVGACMPWLYAELKVVRPDILVLLGATAAQAIFGAQFRVTEQRGKPIKSDLAALVMATTHPSAVLRAPDAEARAEAFRLLVRDLKRVTRALDKFSKK